ncbi:MAG: hypothetical protein QF819_04715 [Gemmatimonadota bacterium]|jgi:hypothetical protein|nr:hypothetical protein [Gemmatimonadota bacterium]MDP6461046.1 hypothetical protein [Gemmatimonadota bacterium]MDP6529674.1 hypothetical protein [Gemmatimonadota bacterium]MDP6802461.1 hypothetical protein [Gemmatimonadota bacterium]MDP7030983.1 hypothetical protein [Gemmatimonadota bacterium]
MSRDRQFFRRFAPVAVLLVALPLASCKDDRGSLADPGTGRLDSDDIFLASRVALDFLQFQNSLAESLLSRMEEGSSAPITGTTCEEPAGSWVLHPSTGEASFEDAKLLCGEWIRYTVDGSMSYTVEETSPVPSWTLSVPELILTLPDSLGRTFTMSAHPTLWDSGGIRCRPSETGTGIRTQGTLRMEDTNLLYSWIHELDLTFSYSAGAVGQWPSGEMEMGAFLFGETILPFTLELDGSGSGVIPYEGGRCRLNFATGENPCSEQED